MFFYGSKDGKKVVTSPRKLKRWSKEIASSINKSDPRFDIEVPKIGIPRFKSL